MQPSHVKHPVIPQHIRLLELAQRAPLFLSPDRQPFIISPLTATAVPLYSEAFFDWFTHSTEARLGICPSSSQIARVIRDLDSSARKAQDTEQIHTRIAKKGTKHYQIDLGTPNIDVVELTGKNWQVAQHFDARFQRLETSDPMPIPQTRPAKLPVYLENMFGISTENAFKLSGWLGQAMLPEQKPPILVITHRPGRRRSRHQAPQLDRPRLPRANRNAHHRQTNGPTSHRKQSARLRHHRPTVGKQNPGL